MMSSSRITSSSSPSTLTSVPEYLPNSTLSPTLIFPACASGIDTLARRAPALSMTPRGTPGAARFPRSTRRSVTLPESTDDGREIFRHCLQLLKKTEAGKRPIRLLGVSLSNLNSSEAKRQRTLFDDGTAHQKDKSLNRALDTIQEKFGDDSIIPGTLLEK